jgi:hypothetical protein
VTNCPRIQESQAPSEPTSEERWQDDGEAAGEHRLA